MGSSSGYFDSEASTPSTSSSQGTMVSTKPLTGESSKFSGYGFQHSKDVLHAFYDVFKLQSFRGNQLEVINASLMGRDCFVMMPTGGGKSLCFQIPGSINHGVTVVLSPLKSLMADQVSKMNALGVSDMFKLKSCFLLHIKFVRINILQSCALFSDTFITTLWRYA